MSSEALDSMYVEFLADYNKLESVVPAFETITKDMSSLAESAGTNISESFDMAGKAAQSFAEMSRMAAESAAEALGKDIKPATEQVDSAFSNMGSHIENTVVQVNTQISGMASHTEEASSAIRESTSSAGGGFTDLFNKVGFAIMNIQNYTSMAKQFATGLLEPAISAETVTSALTTLDGSAAAAAKEMDALNQFAAKTPFKTLDIDQAAEKLQGFGINAKDAIPEITAIGDALGSVGKSTPAEMQSVVDIFGKIHTEGKVTAMTMNELAVHGINGWQALADATGKTIPQVQEMVKKGLLPANDAIKDLTTGIEKNPLYAGGMAKAAGTFTGLLSTLQSNFGQVLAAFGSPILKALEPLLDHLGTTFSSPAFQAFAGSVGEGIVNVFSQIGKLVGDIDISSVGSTLGTIFGQIGQILSHINLGEVLSTITTLAGVVGGILVNAFQTFGPILSQVITWFTNDLLPVFKQVLPPIGNLINTVITLVGTALQPLLAAIEPIIPPILQIAGNIATILTPVVQGLIVVIQPLAGFIAGAFSPLKDAVGFIANITGPLANLVSGFLDVGNAADQMRIKNEEAQTKMALVTDQKTAQSAKDAIAHMELQKQGILKKLKETHNPVEKAELEHQLNMIDIQENFQKERLKKAEDDKKKQVAKQAELHAEMLEAQKNFVQRFLDKMGEWIGSGLGFLGKLKDGLIGKIGETLTNLKDMVGGWFSDFGKFWHDRWNDIVNIFDGVVSGIGKGIKNAINTVIGVINSFIGFIDSIQIHVPSVGVGPVHTPAFDWNGLGIPKIPLLAAGGYVPAGGVAIAGEAGPELVFGGASGAHVVSAAQSQAMMSGGGKVTIMIPLIVDGKQLAMATVDDLGNEILSKIRGHGPLQAVA